MAIKLRIRKKAGNVWEHVKVETTLSIIISKFHAIWKGNSMEVTENTANDILRYDISEIAVHDDTTGGTEETFVTSLAMSQRLKTLGYTAFYTDADLVIADLISGDVSNAIVLGSDGKLFATTGVAVNGLPTGGTIGQILKKQSSTNFDAVWQDPASGGGDMLKSVYDPSSKNADAFDFDNFDQPSTTVTDVDDTDEFPIYDTLADEWLNVSWSNIKATLKTYFDTLYVALTGAQTIAGIKTFSDSPIVPTPTTDFQAAPKKYADLLRTFSFQVTSQENDIVVNTTTAVKRIRMTSAYSAVKFEFGMGVAPTGSAAQFDVKLNGTTVFSTKPTIDATEFTTNTAATPQVLTTSPTAIAIGDFIEVFVTQIGSTIAGRNVVCEIKQQ